MSIGGELTSLIKSIKFSSKSELLTILRTFREEVDTYPKEEQKIILPHLKNAMQQALYTSEWELLKFRNFLVNRRENGRK